MTDLERGMVAEDGEGEPGISLGGRCGWTIP